MLAPQSGGCARHVLSQRVTFWLAVDASVHCRLPPMNPSSRRLLVASTVTLLIEDWPVPMSCLHLTGHLHHIDEDVFRLWIKRSYRMHPSGAKEAVTLLPSPTDS